MSSVHRQAKSTAVDDAMADGEHNLNAELAFVLETSGEIKDIIRHYAW